MLALAVSLFQFFSYNFAGPTLFGILAATDKTGRGSVLYNVAIGIGAALGRLMGGAIVDYDSSFGLLYIVSAIAATCTIGLILRVNRQLVSQLSARSVTA